MPVITESLNLITNGNTDIINITNYVENFVQQHKINEGLVNISVIGSTASIINIEYEPGLLKDLPELLDKIIPQNTLYQHDKKWQDNNAYAHLRASFLGNSKTFALYKSELQIGTWQQIALVDFDNKQRTRKIIMQIVH